MTPADAGSSGSSVVASAHPALSVVRQSAGATGGHALLSERELSSAMRTLRRARAALGGCDASGRRIGPGMFDADVVSFAHGEGVRRPHPAVIAAGVRALMDTVHSSLDNYLFLQRLEPLDTAITRQFLRLGVPEDIARHVVLDAGVSRIFSALLQMGTSPADLLVTHSGFYHPLVQWCHDARLEFECIPCDREHGFKLTAEALSAWAERQLRAGGRLPAVLAIFNPSMAGAVYAQHELDDIASVVAHWDTWVVEDCIFADTEYEELPSAKLAACAEIQDRVVTLCGASKAYALANLRAGWACACGEVARRLQAHIVGHAATLPQIMKFMAMAALSAPRRYLQANTDEVRLRVELVRQLLQSVNDDLPSRGDGSAWIEVALQPRAGHSILLDFSPVLQHLQARGGALSDSIDLVRWTLDTMKLAFSPGASNGWSGGLLRCVHACVGAELTYSASAAAERLAAWHAIEQLAQARPPAAAAGHAHDELEALIEGAGIDSRAGFEAGRTRIRDAFLDRLRPGLRQALQGGSVRRRARLN
ncbi:aminotransferase class I/II-fold pyridoxal phosphate-dependent enzyme [Rubrivivax gelatinosus]|uniref:Aminotransferase n=1 Tax=Rubrivivax gelatinosus TaxID=28068 RepID=A0A4R2MKN2_RUBGE|nr:pyridoxal phosphate-dependent aminotransferase [Rubrivivax gelatinosus]MBK1689406.1 hypothetical protein [Rubrivivax gelatinosus]TCO99722.1 aspartate/methionine/tyrosine aminotransferase [Rubrivivax gelatinosus]